MEEQEQIKIRQDAEDESMQTDRDAEEYLLHFNLNPEDLKGKKILDLGSSTFENFADYANQQGAEVFSVNPRLRYKHYRTNLQTTERNHGKVIAARAQQIPFANESFDLVLSHWCIPNWMPKQNGEIIEEEAEIILQEICRVAKHGGKIIFYPIRFNPDYFLYPKGYKGYRDIYDIIAKNNFGRKAANWLREQQNLSVSTEQVPDGTSLTITKQ